MASFVRIVLAGAGSFAKMEIRASDDISDLVERACVKFPSWKADSAQISLYLVAAGGDEEPAEEVISAVLSSGGRLGVGWSLSRAGISSGAWLVALKIADSGASCPSFARVFPRTPHLSPHTSSPPSLTGASLSGGGGGGGGAAGGSGDIAAALQSLAESQRAIIQMLSQPDGTTVLSDPEYEDQARHKLHEILLSRCGLVVARGADVSRAGLEGQEWDFRAPVLFSATAPHPNGEPDVFEIFPRKPSYVRPEAVEARHVTPTKFSGEASPPAAHYLAILEMTTARKWTHSSGGSSGREGLLERLEKRLAISLDRAHSHGLVREKNILELVAVVGVVAPEPYSDSVRDRMSRVNAPPLLKKMMDASRFVFIKIPKTRAE